MNDKEEIFKKIAQSLKNQGASKIAVFGSYKRLNQETRTKCPDIPWKKMSGMRDKLLTFVKLIRTFFLLPPTKSALALFLLQMQSSIVACNRPSFVTVI